MLAAPRGRARFGGSDMWVVPGTCEDNNTHLTAAVVSRQATPYGVAGVLSSNSPASAVGTSVLGSSCREYYRGMMNTEVQEHMGRG